MDRSTSELRLPVVPLFFGHGLDDPQLYGGFMGCQNFGFLKSTNPLAVDHFASLPLTG